jgi:glycosyltransferase involved in cell wall biosynthesis
VRPLKILFILLIPIPFPGAAWSRVGFFAKYLSNNSFDVRICGAFTPKSLRRAGRSRWNGIDLINCFPTLALPNPLSSVMNGIFSLIISFFILAYLRPDYVLVSVPSTGNPIGCYISSRILGLKVVTDYRDEWEEFIIRNSKSRISRQVYEWQKTSMTQNYIMSSVVITPTNSFATSLKARGVKNVYVLPNGADTRIFRPSQDVKGLRKRYGFSSEDFLIIYSGYIGAYYRVDLIIRSLHELIGDHPNLKLLIMGRGSGSGINEVLKQSSDPIIRDHIIYLGVKEVPVCVAQILSMCDIGIVPYDSNPLWTRSIPVKSLEYIACGLPIFATVSSNSELASLIRDNQLGDFAEPENLQAIVKGLCNLISRRDDRLKARIAGIKLARSTFDRTLIAEMLKQVIMTDAKATSKG